MKKLVLIDGNAILHRAYHALPPLITRKGVMLNAVYGFFSMFISIVNTQKPDYLIVCFDKEKPTFRQTLFVGYQQNRPAMADDLKPQIAVLHKALEDMKVAIFEVEGYEADDLIGTLAKQAVEGKWEVGNEKLEKEMRSEKKSNITPHHPTSHVQPPTSNIEVLIVSGDRDLLQLVNNHVKMLMPVVGLSKSVLMGAKEVEEKYGIKPSQIVDFKALVGDASDGYPGVTGIGPKTASELLKKYGDFENLYKNLSKIPAKLAERLATDAEQASLAKKLATIVTDAPVTLDIKKSSRFNTEGAKKVFKELEFKSLIDRLDQKPANTEAQRSPQKTQKKSEQLDLLD